MTIYVGNLVYDVTTDDLKEVFAEYGTVSRVYLPVDRETGKMRGFGFVEINPTPKSMGLIYAFSFNRGSL